MHNIGDEPLVSGLIYNEYLSTREVLQCLLDGEKIYHGKDNVLYFWLDGNILKTSGLNKNATMTMMFNQDIKFSKDNNNQDKQ